MHISTIDTGEFISIQVTEEDGSQRNVDILKTAYTRETFLLALQYLIRQLTHRSTQDDEPQSTAAA